MTNKIKNLVTGLVVCFFIISLVSVSAQEIKEVELTCDENCYFSFFKGEDTDYMDADITANPFGDFEIDGNCVDVGVISLTSVTVADIQRLGYGSVEGGVVGRTYINKNKDGTHTAFILAKYPNPEGGTNIVMQYKHMGGGGGTTGQTGTGTTTTTGKGLQEIKEVELNSNQNGYFSFSKGKVADYTDADIIVNPFGDFEFDGNYADIGVISLTSITDADIPPSGYEPTGGGIVGRTYINKNKDGTHTAFIITKYTNPQRGEHIIVMQYKNLGSGGITGQTGSGTTTDEVSGEGLNAVDDAWILKEIIKDPMVIAETGTRPTSAMVIPPETPPSYFNYRAGIDDSSAYFNWSWQSANYDSKGNVIEVFCTGQVHQQSTWTIPPSTLVPGQTLKTDLKASFTASREVIKDHHSCYGSLGGHCIRFRVDGFRGRAIEGGSCIDIDKNELSEKSSETVEWSVPQGISGDTLEIKIFPFTTGMGRSDNAIHFIYEYKEGASTTTPPDITPTPTDCTFNGVWSTNWGEMTLTQTGAIVTGTYTHDKGKITGTVSGNTLTGKWSEAPSYSEPNDAGDVELQISGDCKSFSSGKWRYGSSGSWDGDWTGGTWIKDVPLPDITPTPTDITPPPTDPTASPCDGTSTYVYIESITMQKGKEARISVMMCNVKDLANMDFSISYNPSVLDFKNAEKGSLNSNSLFESNEISSGNIKIAFASSKGVSGSGSIAILIFDVVGSNGDSTILTGNVNTASTSSGAGGSTSISINPGKFTVGSSVPGDCDGDGLVTSKDALAALQMSVGKIKTDLCYDVTKDGKVDSSDAREIIKMAVKK